MVQALYAPLFYCWTISRTTSTTYWLSKTRKALPLRYTRTLRLILNKVLLTANGNGILNTASGSRLKATRPTRSPNSTSSHPRMKRLSYRFANVQITDVQMLLGASAFLFKALFYYGIAIFSKT